MKKLILYSLSAILALAVSCQKSPVGNSKGQGALYLGSMELSLDEELDTKASEVSGDYTVSVLNSEGQVVSQLRQVRQRSRCSCVLSVTSLPSSTCLIR